jgi:hypothetical protein
MPLTAKDYAQAVREYGLSAATGAVAPFRAAMIPPKERPKELSDVYRDFGRNVQELTHQPQGAVAEKVNRTIAENMPRSVADALRSVGEWSEKHPMARELGGAIVGAGAIGPLFRGATNLKHLDEGTFYTADPKYADLYANGHSTGGDYFESAQPGAVMGKYELPDEGVVDFSADPALRQELLDWGEEQGLDFSDDMERLGHPYWENRENVVRFLKEKGKDWNVLKLHEDDDYAGPTGFSQISYYLRDPSMAHNILEKGPPTIGPVYRGGRYPEKVEGEFFTEDPHYANTYANKYSDADVPVMTKAVIPKYGHVDFSKDPEMREKWANWLRQGEAQYDKPEHNERWIRDSLKEDYPTFHHVDRLKRFLQEYQPDWQSAKIHEGFEGVGAPDPRYSYLLRDSKLAKTKFGNDK